MEKVFLRAAELLENAARALRRHAGRLAVRRERPSASATRGNSAYPLGVWRCTHADGHFATYFTPGELYRADYAESRFSVRIDHGKGGCWRPYWDDRRQRFCYPANQLDFEYVGPEPDPAAHRR